MKIHTYVMITLPLVAFFALHSFFRPPRVVFCDVGQGDAILIIQGTTQLLIDTGPDRSIETCLYQQMPFFDRTIEIVIISHPDLDHKGGLEHLARYFQIDTLFFNGEPDQEWSMQTLLQIQSLATLADGDRINIADWEIDCLWPPDENTQPRIWDFREKKQIPDIKTRRTPTLLSDTNANSIVIRLKIDAFSALFSGDLPEKYEKRLVDEKKLSQVTLLKAGHHGSKTSTSTPFLEELRPTHIVFSVGKRNSYHHPHQEILDKVIKKQIQIWRTDTITFNLRSKSEVAIHTSRP